MLELLKEAEAEGIDIKETLRGLETLEDLNEVLQFKDNQEFALESIMKVDTSNMIEE